MKSALLLALPLLAAALFPACKSAQKMPDPTSKLIELKTSGCRGYCPMYRLTFWNDGRAEFEGIRNTAQTGLKNFNLTKAELADLQSRTAAANVWQYPIRFESTVADAPGATLTVFDGEKTKSTTGSLERPKPLLELEAHLKSLAEKNGIRVLRGVDPNAPAEATKAEVIVQLEEKINAGNWLMQFEELRLRLVRRVPPANTWVVAYDKNQVDEKTLLDLFKGMDGVINAQSNLRADDRN